MRPTRLLTGLCSMALLVLGLVALLPDCASACSCAGSPGTQQALEQSNAVFSGEVVKIDRPSPFKSSADLETDTFRVSEVWKGPEQRTLEVHTPVMGMSCGYPFKEGQEYLVFAYTGKQGLETDACAPTVPLTEAGAHLRVLGDGWSSGNDSALSDTSGGFPRLDVIGMLGLAVAAVSLAVLMRIVRTG